MSIPNPNIAMAENLPRVDVAFVQPRRRVEQHLSLLALLRIAVAEPPVRRALVQRPPAGDGRRQSVLAGEDARVGAPPQVNVIGTMIFLVAVTLMLVNVLVQRRRGT